jgi:hypothetical protein
MVLSNVAPLRLSVDKGGSFMRRQGRDKYFAIFAEIDHFVMAITAAKAMVRLCVAHLELICTGGLRCVRPLCSLLPPHA